LKIIRVVKVMSRHKIVVIGGIAAGATAAAKAARVNHDTEISLYEKAPNISTATCGLPYYISGDIKDRSKLIIKGTDFLKDKYRIVVHVNSEVIRINRVNKTLKIRDCINGSLTEASYDKLIVATGAHPAAPPIPGLGSPNVFSVRTIEDVDAIEQFISDKKPERAAVLGGGYIGVEVAEGLRKRGIEVSVVEMMPQVLPLFDPEIAQYVEDEMRRIGINVHTNEVVEAIEYGGGKLGTTVVTSKGEKIRTDMIIANMGVKPDLELAEDAGLDIGKFGIIVDEYMRTSDPDIYAAGDVVQVKDIITGNPTWVPLAGPATMQGKIAGANAAGGRLRYKGALHTSLLKFGRIVIGRTGLLEKHLKQDGIDYFPVTIKSTSHANYYPGSTPIHIKILVRKPSGQVIGAQVVGEKGIDKRLDVLATAITAKMTVHDLEQLHLGYAPQFSHSLDPVNIAAMTAAAKLVEPEKLGALG
jgi:NADPH-dependent 2,4-dienoyl-CoA reductase/sulfur reductase-like enzyme